MREVRNFIIGGPDCPGCNHDHGASSLNKKLAKLLDAQIKRQKKKTKRQPRQKPKKRSKR